ncbi:duboraya [Cololabis saira]|uniref:duboraya n=1 Tax=Cololabis saira TaxID=129043 RepID=UPI002AD3AF1E|nr:duboraya [Cololabis saira]
MEDEAPPRRSVAELAGKFKGSGPPLNNSVAGSEAEKPVRRRPPRSLQLTQVHGDGQETPVDGVSSVPHRPKRNSALIEKLQANLALSPTGPPLKSPGIRMLPLAFTPPSPGSAPACMVTTPSTMPTSPTSASPLTEEGPTSFEAPPSAAEGTLLQSISKGRARVSIRRRPPSRRHRKSSSGDAYDAEDGQPNTQTETEDAAGGGGGGEEEEVFKKESQMNASESHEEEESRSSSEVKEKDGASSLQREEEEVSKKESQTNTSESPTMKESNEEEESGSSSEVKEEDGASSLQREEEEEEKCSADKQKEDSSEGAMEEDGEKKDKSESST